MNTEDSVVGEGGCRDSEGWREGVGMVPLRRWCSGVRGVAPPTPLCPSVSVSGLCGSFTRLPSLGATTPHERCDQWIATKGRG